MSERDFFSDFDNEELADVNKGTNKLPSLSVGHYPLLRVLCTKSFVSEKTKHLREKLWVTMFVAEMEVVEAPHYTEADLAAHAHHPKYGSRPLKEGEHVSYVVSSKSNKAQERYLKFVKALNPDMESREEFADFSGKVLADTVQGMHLTCTGEDIAFDDGGHFNKLMFGPSDVPRFEGSASTPEPGSFEEDSEELFPGF